MIRDNPGRMTGVFGRYSDALGWLEIFRLDKEALRNHNGGRCVFVCGRW